MHNVMGIGFNGYDDHGKPRWNQISNVNVINIEVKSSSNISTLLSF